MPGRYYYLLSGVDSSPFLEEALIELEEQCIEHVICREEEHNLDRNLSNSGCQ